MSTSIKSSVKAAIYVRLSKEDRNKTSKESDSESIINQQIMLSEYCKQNNWNIYKIYNDEDFSGSDRERPAFNEMIQDAKEHKFKVVLCKTQSRFARDMEIVEKYINGLFPLWGIRFISVVDNADSTNKFNRKSRQINSLVDQWYLEDLSENIKATLSAKRKQGLYVGAFSPYGYVKDPENKNKLIIDNEAAEVVRYIFNLYLKGFGITAIARKLNEENIPNPATYKHQHGQPFQNIHSSECPDMWHSYSIQRMLSNEVYIGNVVQGRQEKISYKSNKKRQKSKDEWDIVKHTHESIIDNETWDKVQMLRKSKPKSGKKGSQNIFARKVRCLNCGSSMRVYYSNQKRYFRCNTAFLTKNRCSGMTISENVLLREIIKQINHLYGTYIDDKYVANQIEFEYEYKNKITFLQKRIASAKESIEKINKRLKSLYIDKADEIITQDEYILLKNDFEAEKKNLEEQIAACQTEIDEVSDKTNATANRLEIIKQFKVIKTLDFLTANTLIEYIEIGGNRNNRIINLHWNI